MGCVCGVCVARHWRWGQAHGGVEGWVCDACSAVCGVWVKEEVGIAPLWLTRCRRHCPTPPSIAVVVRPRDGAAGAAAGGVSGCEALANAAGPFTHNTCGEDGVCSSSTCKMRHLSPTASAAQRVWRVRPHCLRSNPNTFQQQHDPTERTGIAGRPGRCLVLEEEVGRCSSSS